MKHKHAEIIKAWADGAEIQYLSPMTLKWTDINDPAWEEVIEYRIKPEEKQPVVRWLWANINGSLSTTFASMDEVRAQGCPEQWICLEWSRQEFPE
jgi:hypothetical protein